LDLSFLWQDATYMGCIDIFLHIYVHNLFKVCVKSIQ